MTQIDAEAIVAAPPTSVWRALIDHQRWTEWCSAADGSLHLDDMTLVAGPGEKVGAVRRCTATFTTLPLLGHRKATWTDFVTDVRFPWTIEFEARERAFRRWRLRLTLVPQEDGQTRVHGRMSYVAQRPSIWLADRLFLRRHIAACLESALANVAKTFAPEPAMESLAASASDTQQIAPIGREPASHIAA